MCFFRVGILENIGFSFSHQSYEYKFPNNLESSSCFFFFKLIDLLEAAALKAGEAAGRLTDDIL